MDGLKFGMMPSAANIGFQLSGATRHLAGNTIALYNLRMVVAEATGDARIVRSSQKKSGVVAPIRKAAPRATGKISKRAVAVLGYGSQGRALALNLRDSGYEVSIGLPAGSKSRLAARRDSFRAVFEVSDAVCRSRTVIFAFPDYLQPRIFRRDIAPVLVDGQTLVFLHGTTVGFGLITPPLFVDVVMLAPHGPGLAVRELYLKKESMSCFWAIAQDHSGKALNTLRHLARGGGLATAPKFMVKTSFHKEAVGDLFGEQVVLCGGLSQLIHGGFEILVKAGLSPESAYLEVCHQLDLIVNLIKRFGIVGMFERISVAARYGSLVTGPKIIDTAVRKNMLAALSEITSGRFPRRLVALGEGDIRRLNQALKGLSSPAFERAARKFAKK